MLKLNEKDTQKAILEYLNYAGHFCWRNNSGAFKTAAGGMYWVGTKGAADIIGICKHDGRFISVEVKATGRKATPDQDLFFRNISTFGGHAFVVDSPDKVIQFFVDHGKEEEIKRKYHG